MTPLTLSLSAPLSPARTWVRAHARAHARTHSLDTPNKRPDGVYINPESFPKVYPEYNVTANDFSLDGLIDLSRDYRFAPVRLPCTARAPARPGGGMGRLFFFFFFRALGRC